MEPATGKPSEGSIHHGGTEFTEAAPNVGVVTASMDYNELGGHPTGGDYPIDTSTVNLALAVDEVDRRMSGFGDDAKRPWTGFIQLWGIGATAERLSDIRAVAEYGLLRPRYEGAR